MSQVEETSYTYVQFRNTFSNRQNFRNFTVSSVDDSGLHFSYEDTLGTRHFGVISNLLAAATAITTPGATARGFVVRNLPSGIQAVSGTVTANQGTAGATAWPVIGKDVAGSVPIGGILLVGGYDANGFVQGIPIDTTNNAVFVNFITGASIAVYGNLNPAFPVITTKRIDATLRNLVPSANHLTTNATTTLTAALAFISSIVITIVAPGTGSTIKIQDKSGTPLILVNALTTVAATTTPVVITLDEPIAMTGGIDIITAGAVAATIDVWVTYWQ